MCPDDVAWEQAEETSDKWLAQFLELISSLISTGALVPSLPYSRKVPITSPAATIPKECHGYKILASRCWIKEDKRNETEADATEAKENPDSDTIHDELANTHLSA